MIAADDSENQKVAVPLSVPLSLLLSLSSSPALIVLFDRMNMIDMIKNLKSDLSCMSSC